MRLDLLAPFWLPGAVLLLAVLARRLRPPALGARWTAWGEGWVLPAACALVSALTLAWLFGGLDPVAYVHDEASYLLEAESLARGRFAAPSPPLPEFFEQFHVFTTPVLASRYPPGWPLALVFGTWLGAPVLVPLALTGATAALLVVLVRRLAGPLTALLAWALWLPTPMETYYRPLFVSEHLTGMLWLFGWWALWRWRDDRRTTWLALVATATAWQGITRPVTAIAYALPLAVVILLDVRRGRRWRQLALALLPGIALCLLVPVQDLVVTGNWRSVPMRHYSEVHAPWDLPGFGVDTTPPQVPLTPDQLQYRDAFRHWHATHTVERLPAILQRRVLHIFRWGAGPLGAAGFALLVLLGLVAGKPPLRFAAATAACLVLLYLTFAHPVHWVVYYLETHPVLAAAAAIGIRALVVAVFRREGAEVEGALGEARIGLVLGATALLALALLPAALAEGRDHRREYAYPNEAVRTMTRALPAPAILFIRYAPDHALDRGLVENHDDLERTPVWRVHDLGTRNAELIRRAPTRAPYLYDEASGRVVALASDGVTPRPGPPAYLIPPAPRTD